MTELAITTPNTPHTTALDVLSLVFGKDILELRNELNSSLISKNYRTSSDTRNHLTFHVVRLEKMYDMQVLDKVATEFDNWDSVRYHKNKKIDVTYFIFTSAFVSVHDAYAHARDLRELMEELYPEDYPPEEEKVSLKPETVINYERTFYAFLFFGKVKVNMEVTVNPYGGTTPSYQAEFKVDVFGKQFSLECTDSNFRTILMSNYRHKYIRHPQVPVKDWT